ncbi:hypothetical protein JCM9534A_05880 [Catenuloplanes indicus JCM 9534]
MLVRTGLDSISTGALGSGVGASIHVGLTDTIRSARARWSGVNGDPKRVITVMDDAVHPMVTQHTRTGNRQKRLSQGSGRPRPASWAPARQPDPPWNRSGPTDIRAPVARTAAARPEEGLREIAVGRDGRTDGPRAGEERGHRRDVGRLGRRAER